MFQDLRLKGFHGQNPAFFRSPHLLADQNNVPADDSLTLDRRNADLDSEYLQTVAGEDAEAYERGVSRSGLDERLVTNQALVSLCFQYCGAWWDESIDPAGKWRSESKHQDAAQIVNSSVNYLLGCLQLTESHKRVSLKLQFCLWSGFFFIKCTHAHLKPHITLFSPRLLIHSGLQIV